MYLNLDSEQIPRVYGTECGALDGCLIIFLPLSALVTNIIRRFDAKKRLIVVPIGLRIYATDRQIF